MKMDFLKFMVLHLFLFTIFLDFYQTTAAKDQYTDENRPYEFGFNIEGEQHRREKKDENGLIMGEFGFITADGVYHVTVYATDKEGRFKILSMKNIKLGPAPDTTPKPLLVLTSTLPPPTPQINTGSQIVQRPYEQQLSPSSPRPAVITTAKPLPIASCSHCSIPSTTQAPPPQPIYTPDPELQAPFQNPNNQQGQNQQYPQQGQNQQYPQQGQNQQYPQQGQNQQYPQQGQNQQYPQQGQNQQYPQQGQNQQYPQQGQNQQYPQQGQNQQYPQQGQNQQYPQQGQNQQYPQQGQNQQYPQQGQNQQYPDQQSQQNSQVPLGPNGKPFAPIVISGSIRPTDSSALTKPLGPGEQPGPPPGVTEGDMLTVLYKFNYTIGFHGHYEEGYVNGFKKGEYFVNNRNGIATKVTYFADDKGYHPKIETVRLSDIDTPKEETEKNPEFGLKGYEFHWFYVPKYHYLNQKYNNKK